MNKHQKLTADIIAGLDIRAEYKALAVEFTADSPSGTGYLQCWARDRPHGDAPSAGVHLASGRYKDLGGSGESLSLFDFAVRYGDFTDWRDARKYYAKRAGLGKRLPRKDQEERPQDRFRFVDVPLFPISVRGLCAANAGVTPEALKLCGARTAYYPAKSHAPQLVVCLPVYGPGLLDDDPRGFVAMRADGGKVEIFRGKGAAPSREKKMTAGQSGLMGTLCLNHLQDAEIIYKVEGVTDLLALQTLIPDELRTRHLVFTNAGGTHEYRLLPDFGHLFAGREVRVIHDADQPGQQGASQWAEALAGMGATVRNVQLPYDVAETKGQDLRDWINEGHGYDDLLAMGDGSPVVECADPEKSWEELTAAEKQRIEWHLHLEKIRCEVLGEEGGRIYLFSKAEKNPKIVVINNIDRTGYYSFCKELGQPFLHHVIGPSGGGGNMEFAEFREMVAVLAGETTIDTSSKIGAGVWEDGDNTALVGKGEIVTVTPAGETSRHIVPKVGERLVDSTGSPVWYDLEKLQGNLQAAKSVEWRREVLTRCHQLFAQWHNLKYPECDAELLTGLVMATWLQTVWDFRFTVYVSGASQSGKSSLILKTLLPMFGPLHVVSSDATVAYIINALNNSARMLVLDEFEKAKHREAILNLFRASSDGTGVGRSNARQESTKKTLRHIPWVIATDKGRMKAADLNRCVFFYLEELEDGEGGNLLIPDEAELAELGQQLLAIGVMLWREAVTLAQRLRKLIQEKPDKFATRELETHSIPTAMFAVAWGQSEAVALERFYACLQSRRDADGGGVETERARLLSAILDSQVYCEHGQRPTVLELIQAESYDLQGEVTPEKVLARCGIRVVRSRTGKREERLFLYPEDVQRKLLRDTDWYEADVKGILKQGRDGKTDQQRINGVRRRGVSFPINLLGLENDQPDTSLDFPEKS